MTSTESQKEQVYLDQVYEELLKAKNRLEDYLDQTKDSGLSQIKAMSGDLSLNFSNDSDSLETYAMLESKNREIDQVNFQLKLASEQLKRIVNLLRSPYFGKIGVDFLEQEPVEFFYIGTNNFSNGEGADLIYDWRAPIAELFYNNETGPSGYRVNDQDISVSIENRRQFIIKKNQLLRFFDTTVAIQDDILLKVLETDETGFMQDITATIQKEQNQIIRDQVHPNILVNGIAGSGKTSTIMQRIAYLLYNLRAEVSADNMIIFSPNDSFVHYLSHVLPNLGEKNPLNLTLLRYVSDNLGLMVEKEPDYFERVSQSSLSQEINVIRSLRFVTAIKEAGELLKTTATSFKAITSRGKIVISKKRIKRFYEETDPLLSYSERLQATKNKIATYWTRQLQKTAKSDAIQNQVLSLSEGLQRKYFGSEIADDSTQSVLRYGYQLLDRKYGSVRSSIAHYKWLDYRDLFATIYAELEGETYVWQDENTVTLDEAVGLLLIKHFYVERLEERTIRFVLIDEIQDYTVAQLALLFELFPKARFTAVGDENQAIFNSYSPFDQIATLFKTNQKSLERYDLLNSYRSSGAITNLFSHVLKNNGQEPSESIDIIPVRPKGELPVLWAQDESNDISEIVSAIITKDNLDSLTILTKTQQQANRLKEILGPDMKWVKKDSEKCSVTVLPISLAKGLEFDNVLVYDVSKEAYQSKKDHKVLYTQMSRAMERLYITYLNDDPADILLSAVDQQLMVTSDPWYGGENEE